MMHYLQYHIYLYCTYSTGPHKTTGVTKDQKYSLAYPVTEACKAGEMDETFRHRFRDPSMCDRGWVVPLQDKGTIAKPELM